MDEDVAAYAASVGAQSVVDWLAGMNIQTDEELIDNYSHFWSIDFDVELNHMGMSFQDLGLTKADFGRMLNEAS